jgi:hypothetical protein
MDPEWAAKRAAKTPHQQELSAATPRLEKGIFTASVREIAKFAAWKMCSTVSHERKMVFDWSGQAYSQQRTSCIQSRLIPL